MAGSGRPGAIGVKVGHLINTFSTSPTLVAGDFNTQLFRRDGGEDTWHEDMVARGLERKLSQKGMLGSDGRYHLDLTPIERLSKELEFTSICELANDSTPTSESGLVVIDGFLVSRSFLEHWEYVIGSYEVYPGGPGDHRVATCAFARKA